MFPEMRRTKQQLSAEEARAILADCTSGVLSLAGEDGYPYGVPLSYVLAGDKIYFHCAVEGHKINAIGRSEKASFCVIADDDIVPEKYTTCYRSVILFGRIRIITDEAEKRNAIEKLAVKYAPGESEESRKGEIDRGWHHMHLLEFTIEQMTGKAARELLRRRQEMS